MTFDLGVRENLADENSVHSEASFAAELNDRRVGVRLLEEEDFMVSEDKLILSLIHQLIHGLEHEKMPARAEAEVLPERAHAVEQKSLDYGRVERAVLASELDLSERRGLRQHV